MRESLKNKIQNKTLNFAKVPKVKKKKKKKKKKKLPNYVMLDK